MLSRDPSLTPFPPPPTVFPPPPYPKMPARAGTNPAMYFGPANSTADANKWVLYFKGGGWCYDLAR